jgi:hypothetical protein
MKHHRRSEWERELEARQRNIVFPDTVRNDRLVNELLWKGNPHATRVQRIGIAILSIGPLAVAAVLLSFVWSDPNPQILDVAGVLLMALPFILLGSRWLRNAFLRSPSKSDHGHHRTDHKQHPSS